MTKQTLNNTINSRIKNIITEYKKMKSVQRKLKTLGPEWVMCHCRQEIQEFAMHSCIIIASWEMANSNPNKMMQNMQNPDSSLPSNTSA